MATHSSIPCLGNPMDTGAWRAMAHGVAKELDMTQELNNNRGYLPLPLCYFKVYTLSLGNSRKKRALRKVMKAYLMNTLNSINADKNYFRI